MDQKISEPSLRHPDTISHSSTIHPLDRQTDKTDRIGDKPMQHLLTIYCIIARQLTVKNFCCTVSYFQNNVSKQDLPLWTSGFGVNHSS